MNMLHRYLSYINESDLAAVTDMIAEFRLLVGNPIRVWGTQTEFSLNFHFRFELTIRNGFAQRLQVHNAVDLPYSAFHLPNLRHLIMHDSLDPAFLATLSQLQSLEFLNDSFDPETVDSLKSLRLFSLTIQQTTSGIPEGLGELSTLRSLDLCLNTLEEVPPFLYDMHFLVELSLADNHLRHFDPQWGDLKGLQVLNLRHNYLSTVHALARLPQLKEADVSFNRLKRISPDLRYLHNLRKFHAEGNPLHLNPQYSVFGTVHS